MAIDQSKLEPKALGTLFLQTEHNSNICYSLGCVYLYESDGLKIEEVGFIDSGEEKIATFQYTYTDGPPDDEAKIRPYIVGPYMPVQGAEGPQIANYIAIENSQNSEQRKKGKVNTSKPILLPTIPGAEEEPESYPMYMPRSIVIEKLLSNVILQFDEDESLVISSGYFMFILAKIYNHTNKWMTNSYINNAIIHCEVDMSEQEQDPVNAVSIASIDELNQYNTIQVTAGETTMTNNVDYGVIKIFDELS